MREIKLRAWDQFNAVFYYSKDYENLSLFFIQIQNCIDGGNHIVIEQYTGLKDKNGVEIYEGDIKDLTGDLKHLIVVVWNDETCSFCAKPSNGELSDHLYGGQLSEVIGNVYENPELLKDQNNG